MAGVEKTLWCCGQPRYTEGKDFVLISVVAKVTEKQVMIPRQEYDSPVERIIGFGVRFSPGVFSDSPREAVEKALKRHEEIVQRMRTELGMEERALKQLRELHDKQALSGLGAECSS